MRVYLEVKTRTNKHGLSEIYVTVSGGRDGRKMIKTGFQIPPAQWNHNKQVVRRSYPNYDSINRAVQLKRAEIQKLVLDQSRINPYFSFLDFKDLVDGTRRGKDVLKGKPTLFQALEYHIDSLQGNVVNDTIKDYRSLTKHLHGFEKKKRRTITWESMDYKFYEAFSSYLSLEAVKKNGEVGMSKNYAGKLVKDLKAFLRKSMLRQDCPHINLDGWKVETEVVDHVYLNEKELEQVWKTDLSDDWKLEKVRDLFIVGAETGLRISDFTSDLRFALDNENDGLIRYTVQKTLQKVVIPITPRLREVMDKYACDFPKMHKNKFNILIKEVMKRCGIVEKVQRWKTIRGKKEVEWVEKWRLVSSHTCRRSFCTNAYKRGVHPVVIRQVSGHTTEKALMRYIKVSAHEVAEGLLKNWGRG